jgi:hypothetical protein
MLRVADHKPGRLDSPGIIQPDSIYRIDEACTRLGWGDHALRAARRRGLKIHRSGKRNYVLGSDLLAFITKEKA